MFIDLFQSTDGGLMMFENFDHMTGDEYVDYSMEAHWDVDQGDTLNQGPVGPDGTHWMYWSQYTIVNIYDTVVDEWGTTIGT